MPFNAKFEGLSPNFEDAFRQHLLTTFSMTDEKTFELVIKHYDLDLLFKVIILKQEAAPFYKSDMCKPFLTYLNYLPPPFNCPKYFLAVAVPIYRERFLKAMTGCLEHNVDKIHIK